ncbi:MAG: HU family DNA-binding protein [Caulobacteraceae bacterium]
MHLLSPSLSLNKEDVVNQAELIEKVAASAELEKAEAGRLVDAVLTAVSDALKAGDKVSLSSLGIFDINDRKARQGRNPATGEAIQIAASKSIKFRPTKSLKDAVSPPTKSTPAKGAAKSDAKTAAPKKKAAAK